MGKRDNPTLLNFLTPVRAGEAARLWWLRRRRLSLVGGLGMVVIDRGFDLSGVALVLGTGALTRWVVGGRLPSMPQMLVPLGLALATFGAIALTILAGPRVISSRHERRMLPRAWHDRASRHASAMRGAARQLRCRCQLSLVIATSAAAVAVDELAQLVTGPFREVAAFGDESTALMMFEIPTSAFGMQRDAAYYEVRDGKIQSELRPTGPVRDPGLRRHCHPRCNGAAAVADATTGAVERTPHGRPITNARDLRGCMTASRRWGRICALYNWVAPEGRDLRTRTTGSLPRVGICALVQLGRSGGLGSAHSYNWVAPEGRDLRRRTPAPRGAHVTGGASAPARSVLEAGGTRRARMAS